MRMRRLILTMLHMLACNAGVLPLSSTDPCSLLWPALRARYLSAQNPPFPSMPPKRTIGLRHPC